MANGRRDPAQQPRQGRSGGPAHRRPLDEGIPSPQPVQYFSGGQAPNPALVTEQAEKVAKDSKYVAASQIRRFYGDVAAFDRRLALDDTVADDAIRAQMGLLKAKAVYAHARLGNRDKENFATLRQYLIDHTAAVKDRKTFEAFRRSFEAVIAYHKFYEIKKQGD
jgi:CRISPR-associated protein Csm2